MIFLYSIISLIVWWSLSGYYLFLHSINKKFIILEDKGRKRLLKIAVVIPCYNEEHSIKTKIDNLRNIDYPENLFNVYFLNGKSTDNTSLIINNEIKDLNSYFLIETGMTGKIPQINHYLPKIKGDIIVQTDVDGILPSDVLKKFSNIFRDNSDIGVVGAYVLPKHSIDEDFLFWETQNAMRMVESNIGMSSVVIAACFAYRKELLTSYNEDVIADDVYIIFTVQNMKKRSVYCQNILVYESRASMSLKEFFFHKLRKGNAIMCEMIRFFPIPINNRLWALVYYTKYIQIFIAPISILFFGIMSLFYAWHNIFLTSIVFMLLIFSISLSSLLFKRYQLAGSRNRGSLIKQFKAFVILNVVLVINLIIYPFYKQTSSFKKVGL